MLADKGCDADDPRKSLRQAAAVSVIPGRANRKITYNKARCHGRHRIKNAFCRLKGFRRVATRHDKLAANFLSAATLVTLVAWV